MREDECMFMNYGESMEQKLLQQIEEQENQLPGLYTLLGKRYYELFHDSMQIELREEVEAVSRQLQDIQQLKKQLQKVQAGRLCPSCGTETADDDRFCPVCGTRLRTDEAGESSENYCPRCGNSVSGNQRFCVKCGYELMKNRDDVFFADHIAPEEEEHNEEACPNCGASIEADMKFCIVCGQKLR